MQHALSPSPPPLGALLQALRPRPRLRHGPRHEAVAPQAARQVRGAAACLPLCCALQLPAGSPAPAGASRLLTPALPCRPAALPTPCVERRQKKLQKKLQREQQRIRRLEAQSGGRPEPKDDEPAASKAAPKDEPPSDDDEGIDDDDLIASTAGMEEAAAQQQQQRGGPWAPPSVLASASCGLGRAAVALQRAFHAAAVRAPPRRQLTRPQRAAQ